MPKHLHEHCAQSAFGIGNDDLGRVRRDVALATVIRGAVVEPAAAGSTQITSAAAAST
jgi:hypothetical protein